MFVLDFILCLSGTFFVAACVDFFMRWWQQQPIKEEEGGTILYIKKELFKQLTSF